MPNVDEPVGLAEVDDVGDSAPGGGSTAADIRILEERLAAVDRAIAHEDNLLTQRMGWLWALQGLLFTAFGVLDSVLPKIVICVVGSFSSLSIRYSLEIGGRVLRQCHAEARPLREYIRCYYREKEAKLGIRIEEPNQAKSERHLLFPWRLVPWMFIAAWAALAVYAGFHS